MDPVIAILVPLSVFLVLVFLTAYFIKSALYMNKDAEGAVINQASDAAGNSSSIKR